MAVFREFIVSGRAIDLMLAFMAVEFAFLGWRARTRKGALSGLLLALAPGACLLLAIRAALTGASWVWIAALLAASLPFHLADLRKRRR